MYLLLYLSDRLFAIILLVKKHSSGFTVIEVIFIALLLGVVSVIFFIQKNSLEVIASDNHRKTAINAMYYGLEEVFYPENGYYPQSIDSETLRSVDPALFTDPDGYAIGTTGSSYLYSPAECTDKKCQSYRLSTVLKNEDDFVKENRNN